MEKGAMMKKNYGLMLFGIIFLGIFSISTISAAASSMSAPVTSGNYTNSLTVTIFYNGFNAINMSNVTCYYNSSGGGTNVKFLTILNTTDDQTTFTDTNTTMLDETATYNISCDLNEATKRNITFYANLITIDGTAPTNHIFGTGIQVDYANLSKSHIYINMTNSTELYRKDINFTIYYSNGTLVNATTYADSLYAHSINVTGLAEGRYKYNVTVCDYSGNCNTTVTRNILLDRTAPTPTYSCSDSIVSEGVSVSCSCSAVDNYDINPTLVFDSNPATTNAGTYTISCIATDHASKSSNVSLSYTVDASGGDYAPGTTTGGTTVYTTTYAENSEEFSEIKEVSKELGTKSRIIIKINNINHEVGVKELTATTATIEVSSTPQTATLNIGDTRRFDLTEDGYYDLSVTLNKIEADKADVTMKSINILITEETIAEEADVEEEAVEQQAEDLGIEEAMSTTTILIIVGIIIILVAVGIWYNKYKK